MADIDVTRTERAVTRTGFRLSWGAILAGFFVALGLHFVLALLGVAVGMTAWDPAQPGGVGGGEVAAGLGIWAALSGLIALFVGGMTTGRLAGILRGRDGLLHGVVLWSLTTVMLMWLVISGVGMVVGGVFRVAGAATGAVGQAVGAVAPGVAEPALMAGMRGEDRETLVQEIARQTGLTRDEADRIVGDAERTQQRVTTGVDTLVERAPQAAQDVADATATAAWWTLLGLVLSLGAAVGGTAVTARD